MSTTELVIEKAKALNEEEAKAVLTYIARLPRERCWTAQELMRLPLRERSRILEAQSAGAAEHYRNNPDLIMDVVDAPLEYE